MRVAPIGLVREFTVERAYALALRAAAQTHGHPEGYLPAGALAAIVRSLVDGATLEAAAAGALDLLARSPRSKPTAEALRAALSPNTSVRALGTGWVGEEALAIGLHAALAGRDFADAIRLAANHDGDSDSTASIAGQILGASFGEAALPAGWADGLDCMAELLEMESRLAWKSHGY